MSDPVGRRKWLSALVPRATEALVRPLEARAERAFPPQMRPPGALPEVSFLALCTRCDRCVAACEHGAVMRFTATAGPLLRNTPVMRPDERPCHMCRDFPCVQACAAGALEMPRAKVTAIAVARIDLALCLTSMGPECGACVGLCPDGLKGVTMVGRGPRVDPKACVGCGLCVQACPVSPKAIVIEERKTEPRRPELT